GPSVARADRGRGVDDHEVETLLSGAHRKALALHLRPLVRDRELPFRWGVVLGCRAPGHGTAGAARAGVDDPAALCASRGRIEQESRALYVDRLHRVGIGSVVAVEGGEVEHSVAALDGAGQGRGIEQVT